MNIKLETRDKKTFIVIEAEVPDPKKLPASKSGKSLLLASSNGNLNTGVKFNGKDIIVGLNAYIKSE